MAQQRAPGVARLSRRQPRRDTRPSPLRRPGRAGVGQVWLDGDVAPPRGRDGKMCPVDGRTALVHDLQVDAAPARDASVISTCGIDGTMPEPATKRVAHEEEDEQQGGQELRRHEESRRPARQAAWIGP